MKNAPARQGQSVFVLLPGNNDALITTAIRAQFLTRRGVPETRANLIAGLAFREVPA